MKNLFIYFFAQSIFLSSPLQISYYFALPIAQICSIPHSKSLSFFFFLFFFLSLTHCPYFLSFPLQISNFFNHQQPHKIQPSNTLTTKKTNHHQHTNVQKTQNQTQTHKHSKPNSNPGLHQWNSNPKLPKFIGCKLA